MLTPLRPDELGRYFMDHLLPGTYFVITDDEGFLRQLYDGNSCFSDCDPLDGTAVEVDANSIISDINFVLDAGGMISGIVTEAQTGEPLESSGVFVLNAEGETVASGSVDDSGHYTVMGLPPGTYFARANSHEGFLDEVYNDVPCPLECDLTAATPLAVDVYRAGKVTGINFALDRLGAITAEVTDVSTGEPITEAAIEIWIIDGEQIGNGNTDSFGVAVVGDLPPGIYFATTQNNGGYRDEIYDGLPCPDRFVGDRCNPTKGTPITVTSGMATPIQISLSVED